GELWTVRRSGAPVVARRHADRLFLRSKPQLRHLDSRHPYGQRAAGDERPGPGLRTGMVAGRSRDRVPVDEAKTGRGAVTRPGSAPDFRVVDQCRYGRRATIVGHERPAWAA